MYRKLAVLSFLLSSLVAFPYSSWALGYGFFQGGFSEGAFITGFAGGEDYNHDGILTYATGPLELGMTPVHQEIQQLGFFFSGNSLIHSFQLGIEAFSQPPYLLSGFDETFHFRIGPTIFNILGRPWESFLAQCATFACLGFNFTGPQVDATGGGATHILMDRSSEPIFIFGAPELPARQMPEPSTFILAGIGLLALAVRFRKTVRSKE